MFASQIYVGLVSRPKQHLVTKVDFTHDPAVRTRYHLPPISLYLRRRCAWIGNASPGDVCAIHTSHDMAWMACKMCNWLLTHKSGVAPAFDREGMQGFTGFTRQDTRQTPVPPIYMSRVH